ncbi:MAG: DUF1385 domain-containing protein [Oscillospiraceae bacterium]|nr:DUF1385 domain-containing protein [Oscillospiraceae bacterium]
MAKKNKTEKFRSKIGGQALIEGIMMRGIGRSAMACRLPDGTIDVETWENKNGKNAPWYTKVPFLRGSVNMIISLADGYKCLTKSMEKQGDEYVGESETKFEKWLEEKLGDKLMPVLTVISGILGVALTLVLFLWLPSFISEFLRPIISGIPYETLKQATESGTPVDMPSYVTPVMVTIEGIIKMIIFVLYLYITSKMSDMRTMYKYHGAEHKTIACYEAGEELTVENVKKHPRFHKRCGTSFIVLTLIVSIIAGSFIKYDNVIQRMGYRILLLPLIVGVSYELIKIAGRHDNIITAIISAPGLWLQRITTNEPDEKQIECAIEALKPCIPDDKEDDKW